LGFHYFSDMSKRDTTVKLDGALVEEVARELVPGQTLTGFVRDAVGYRIRRSRMRKAAEAYRNAVQADPKLAAEMAEWERADLNVAPKAADGSDLS
jgi:hypothetical protein